MKNLLYKEYKLAIHPMFYLVALLSALLLIPNWVYFMAMSYVFFITITNIFTSSKANNDINISLMMPIRRRDIVKARLMSIISLQVLQIVVAIPFAIINQVLYPYENFLLDTNIAFFGFVFIMYAIFNAIFFIMFYKTGYKVGIPALLSIAVAILFATGIEVLALVVPILHSAFDGDSGSMFPIKLLILLGGIAIFIVSSIITYKVSASRFEKVDL